MRRYPLAVVADLSPHCQHAAQLLGRRLVLWRDGSGAWRAKADRCPPQLSEERIAPSTGTLACCGRNWRPSRDYAAKSIHQAEGGSAEAAPDASTCACAVEHPAQVYTLHCGRASLMTFYKPLTHFAYLTGLVP